MTVGYCSGGTSRRTWHPSQRTYLEQVAFPGPQIDVELQKHGIEYRCSEKTKSDLYRDLLPLLNAGRITLPRAWTIR